MRYERLYKKHTGKEEYDARRFEVSDIIPATAQEIYDTWLGTEGHANMTGGARRPALI